MTDSATSASMGPAAPGDVMITWAHDANDPAAQEAWTQQVFTFAVALRRVGGIEADVDLFHLFEAGIDWTRWGPTRVRTASCILIVINAAWRERFEGEGPPTRGAGAAAEANILHGLFADNRQTFGTRTVVVVLPGASQADVPLQLRGLQRVELNSFDGAGLENLIRILTDQPLYPKPAVGRIPVLPPATQQDIHRVAQHPEQLRPTPAEQDSSTHGRPTTAHALADLSATSTLSAAGQLVPAAADGEAHTSGEATVSLTPVDETTLRAWASIAQASIGSLTQRLDAEVGTTVEQGVQEGAERSHATDLSRSGGGVEVDTASAETLRKLAELLERAYPAGQQAPPRRPTLSEETGALLRPQLERIATWLERPNRCWLLLAAQPVTTSAQQGQPAPAGAKGRAEHVLRRLVEETSPPVLLSGFDTATRAARRTVFAGHPSPAFQPGPRSGRWRLELGDRGEGVAAASISGDVRADGGFFGPTGQSEQDTVEARLSLPVRRDRLEMWLLVQLELLAAHYRSTADADPQAEINKPLKIGLQARLLLPPDLTLADHHQSTVAGVEVVEEHRDPDGHPTGEFPCSGGRPLPLEAETVDTEVLIIDTGWLDSAHALITYAHNLAVQLLEHFGLESTQVLTDGGELDELAAGAADQQHIWQHARALGIPYDSVSPAMRRQQHTDLVAQARAALRR